MMTSKNGNVVLHASPNESSNMDPEENPSPPESEENNCDRNLPGGNNLKKPSEFSHSEVFRLRHQLVITLEELKLLKECEDRNDIKIKQLLSQVYELEKAKDSLQHHLKQEETRSTTVTVQLKQLREELENRASNHHNEAGDGASNNDMDLRFFKGEARKLQLVNYQQENTIKSLEAKLQSQANSTHQAMTQMSGLEDKVSNITKLYQETSAYMTHLEEAGKYMSHYDTVIDILCVNT